MQSENITIGMLAHVDAGKTTLSEALLLKTGAIRKAGRVDSKDTFLDTDVYEKKRGITIFVGEAHSRLFDKNITILDTPGHIDFSAEMERTLQVLDYAVLIINACDGVTGYTKTLFSLLSRYHIPVFIFVNKMDMTGANRWSVFSQIKANLSENAVDFTDYSLTKKGLEAGSKESGLDLKEGVTGSKEGLDGLDEAAIERLSELYENIAVSDEAAMEEYLTNSELSLACLQRLLADRKIFPVFFGSALKMKGLDEFMEGLARLVTYKTYPDQLGLKVFKISRDSAGVRLSHVKVTGGSLKAKELVADEKINQIRLLQGDSSKALTSAVAGDICALTGLEKTKAGDSYGCDQESEIPLMIPVVSYAIKIEDGSDLALLVPKLRELEEEEPQLHVLYDSVVNQVQIQVMGQVQGEIIRQLIFDRFGVEVSFGQGKIIYKETIADTVEGIGHYEPLKHYSEVHLIIEPGARGSGIKIKDEASTDILPLNFQKQVISTLEYSELKGVLTGSGLTDLVITLASGKAHIKHTEGGDFREASLRALRQGLMKAESYLLEPYLNLDIELEQGLVGRVMTDLSQMGAEFKLSDGNADNMTSKISGRVPVSAFADYSLTFSSFAGPSSSLRTSFAGYDRCKNEQEVIEACAYDPCLDTTASPDSVFCSHGSAELVKWDMVDERAHLESVKKNPLFAPYFGIDISQLKTELSLIKGPKKSDIEAIGTDEIDAIIRATSGANRKDDKRNPFKKRHESRIYNYDKAEEAKTETETEAKAEAKAEVKTQAKTEAKAEKSKKISKSYMLVDSYNVIYAWDELRDLASINIDSARGKLLDILANYQAMYGMELIAVFDAYRVKNHATEVYDYHNIHVVFTKTAETADRYIEKFAHEHGRQDRVRVVTSDGQEQIIILGQGCERVSSREFELEVKAMEEYIRENYMS